MNSVQSDERKASSDEFAAIDSSAAGIKRFFCPQCKRPRPLHGSVVYNYADGQIARYCGRCEYRYQFNKQKR